MFPTTLPFFVKVKKGIVTKGGRFRPNDVALRTHSGPVLLHSSSVNRFEQILKVNHSRYLLSWCACKLIGPFCFQRKSRVSKSLADLFQCCKVQRECFHQRLLCGSSSCSAVAHRL